MSLSNANIKKISGWGNYPIITGQILTPTKEQIPAIVAQTMIPHGLGRSYGDSALGQTVISTKKLNRFIEFDHQKGILNCDAGISLDEILQLIVPKGWFLSVTPGTKFVTVAGAIAADAHGKNHHCDGCFSEYIIDFKIIIDDRILTCSKTQNSDLFHATCGGIGLTGIIIEARLKLKPIKSSYIQQTTIKAKNLESLLDLFELYKNYTYSVAWIDCLVTGKDLGRSLLMLGEHADNGELTTHSESKLSIPCNLPAIMLNQYSVQTFNSLYYHRIRTTELNETIHYQPFFYPLDSINHWNRLYGKNGFVQYQFVIPKTAGLAGLSEILNTIAQSKQGSFLSVLKVFGKNNHNLLSFPTEGYTLALDFKLNNKLFPLLEQLDQIVQSYHGRLYLVKDARMSEQMFKMGYPKWLEFQDIRSKYGAIEHYGSTQSQRIGL